MLGTPELVLRSALDFPHLPDVVEDVHQGRVGHGEHDELGALGGGAV